MICKIFGLFVNTLTADDMHALLNKNSLTEPIQVYLSKKEKTLSDLLAVFFN